MYQRAMKPNRIPEITMKDQVYRKILAYADLCSNEISALGSVQIENNKIMIDDIHLFEQIVSGASTVMSQKDISQFLCDYIKNGKDPSALKFWWHSHVHMQAFWSGTDTDTINNFSSDWMISMVSNKQGDFKIRLDMFKPFRASFEDLPLTIEYDRSYNEEVKNEIDSKVKSYYPFLPEIRGMLTSHSPSAYPADNRAAADIVLDPVVSSNHNSMKDGLMKDDLTGFSDTYHPVLARKLAEDPNPKPTPLNISVPGREVPKYYPTTKSSIPYECPISNINSLKECPTKGACEVQKYCSMRPVVMTEYDKATSAVPKIYKRNWLARALFGERWG